MSSEQRNETALPLRAAFDEWVAGHRYVWFDSDLRLAAALAQHFDISLEIDGVAVTEGDVPGVTQG